MASSAFAVDPDDGFDWEAAVREIDNACDLASNHQKVVPPPAARTPAAAEPRPRPPRPDPNGKGRQPTLDRFVDSFTKRKKESNRTARPCIYKTPNLDCGGCDNPQAEGGESAVTIDLEAAKTWIYPVNVPLRDYQFAITKVALFSNTLVALPTGLGKTLIAAVVMYNYFRWFPEGKIVFTAPSRPLVMQQIEACHNIVGIPQEWAIDMTGQMSPLKRSSFWKSKRVFFVTPQVFEKDIQSGICLVKQLVCLVIDEAHRAMGNYSYCVAVRELLAIPVQLRILALTATPGSKQQTIQNVIDNLCISTLEYRNESDHDVSPYVHNRTIELIEVEMGKDATVIYDLLLEALRSYATPLISCGMFYNRDFATLSPCELLTLRDRFRQVPPPSLEQEKHKQLEGCFGMLLTLFHIRKLLTSHGVRPAFEMLDEKLHCSGLFARFANRNETIMKVKLLMQQSLSRGAPNPKLVKLIEILREHFKEKDPKESRVIIFSNFRGSVKDIMGSLSTIGDLVKATEFIGQSSGKALKGQTQKMQQAVLHKFRNGGYNVIVATSIGEEGLDIMEVDLVICFDANVSPLRMIQRMGRTGRKHDGRVVVLACEGSEVKAYRKKQASGKAVRKHMHNGGIQSFSFHPSPRMVPHICKPEAQLVEMSIEQFIPRGKKLKDDLIHKSPVSKKLLDEEKGKIARYFQSAREDIWEPSLIAFPIFQTFPSRIHELRHSFRTTAMLIDAMQRLHGLPLSKANHTSELEGEASYPLQEAAAVMVQKSEKATLEKKTSVEEHEGTLMETPQPEYGLQVRDHPMRNLSSHIFLFGEQYVNVNSSGGIIIASVPCLSHRGTAVPEAIPADDEKYFHTNTVGLEVRTTHLKDVKETEIVMEHKLLSVGCTELLKYSAQSNHSLENPVSRQGPVNQEDTVAEATVNAGKIMQSPSALGSDHTAKDMQLSPRLSHFIEEGIVPESPIVNHNPSVAGNTVSSEITPTCLQLKEEVVIEEHQVKGESYNQVAVPDTRLSGKGSADADKDGLVDAQLCHSEVRDRINVIYSPINGDIRTPLVNFIDNSSDENWQQSYQELPKALSPAPKYKRLRKFADLAKGPSCNKENNCSLPKTSFPTIRNKSKLVDAMKGQSGKNKKYTSSFSFIEEEAEVSQDAQVSEDEEDYHEDVYDDSFIDDRTNPTEVSAEASTDAENSGDMIAFYRRSLLTQSPAECLPDSMATPHGSFSSRTAETGSCPSEKVYHQFKTPKNGLRSAEHSTGKMSVTCPMNSERTALVCENSANNITKLETRKRKLSFQQISCTSASDTRVDHFAELEHSEKGLPQQNRMSTDASTNLLCDDDDFFVGLDLDAVEAQAAALLRQKSSLAVPSHSAQTRGNADMNVLCSPSFDLGI